MSIASLVPGPLHRPRNSALAKLAVMGRARRMDTMNGGDKVKAPVGDYPRVKAMRSGEHATSGGMIYFKEGADQLTEEHKRTLQATAQVIGGKPQKIGIRGHTSTRQGADGAPHPRRWLLKLASGRRLGGVSFAVAGKLA